MRTKRLAVLFAAAAALLLHGSVSLASGISVDAGLTPPQDRWILRLQARTMVREQNTGTMVRRMRTYAFPAILAYGVRRDLMLLVRQAVVHRRTRMMGVNEQGTGLGDLFFLGKYALLRSNTRSATVGLAATAGFEIPTGSDEFSKDTWNVHPGLYSSLRSGPWGSDLNVAFSWNGLAGERPNGVHPGNAISANWAVSHQFSLGDSGELALAPVLESSFERVLPDRLDGGAVPNTGEVVILVSPGAKFTWSSVIVEALLQIPAWQDQAGSLLPRGLGGIGGIRLLF